MTEPTDAEFDAIWDEADFGPEGEVHRRFARSVLAKWGAQPVPAGYALVPVEPTPEMLSVIWVHKNSSLVDAYRAMLAAAPQPVVREPLTDEQLEKLRIGQEYWQWGLSEAVFRYVARAIERAHGITQSDDTP